MVVSSGGTYLVPHYRLMPKLLDFLVVLALGRPLVLFTQSLGPFHGVGQRWLLRRVLSRATLILVRDERSLGYLRRLGVPSDRVRVCADAAFRSEEHTSELQSLMRISYAVLCLKKK